MTDLLALKNGIPTETQDVDAGSSSRNTYKEFGRVINSEMSIQDALNNIKKAVNIIRLLRKEGTPMKALVICFFGRGNKNGDWVLSDGVLQYEQLLELISFCNNRENLSCINRKHYNVKVHVISACCYSECWTTKHYQDRLLDEDHDDIVSIIASCGDGDDDEETRDTLFSRALFGRKHSEDIEDLLSECTPVVSY